MATNRIDVTRQTQTAETDTTKRLAPDGAGGVEWGTGGGGGSSPLTTKGDVYGYDSADARIPVGSDGEVLTADSGASLGVSWQASGGGGGITMPQVVQVKGNGNGATSITVTAAPSGHSFILFTNATTGQVSAVSCTNVTWTQLKTFTSAGSSFYAIWVGVCTGTSGTSISMTKPGSFNTAIVAEVADTLTPTLGASLAVDIGINDFAVLNYKSITSVTAGHLIAYASGSDNTTNFSRLSPSAPAAGAAEGKGAALVVGYAATVRADLQANGSPAGAALICEIT